MRDDSDSVRCQVGDLGIRKELYKKSKCCHMSEDEHDTKAQAGKDKLR